jgi:hypothetical protein
LSGDHPGDVLTGQRGIQQYRTVESYISALNFVIETQLAHVLAFEPTEKRADALVARARKASVLEASGELTLAIRGDNWRHT